MSINKSYAVFGLGRYGFAVATELAKSGADVLAVDIDENIINSAATVIPYCKCADVTDVEVLRQLGISNVDVVIIAMATNLDANVMAIMLCKELGVKTVIAKCSDDMQGKIFTKVGADKVVIPEREGGVRLAKNILSSGFVDVMELSDDVCIWQNFYNEKTKICDFLITLFKDIGGVYERYEETGRERMYTIRALRSALVSTGFEVLGAYSDFNFSAASDDGCDRIYVVARCKKP
jgi:trk system potassium uptake protein TrkA